MGAIQASRAVLPAALITALALAACGGDEEADETASESGCRKVEAPPAKQVQLAAPNRQVGKRETVVAVFKTSCGSFEVTLDGRHSPKTAGSFAYLVEQGVYDGTTFHRVVPDFVVQGGDPEGTGQGGPGYSIEEAPPDSAAYTKGMVAMAKTGAEPPGTSGSQFFVVTAEDAGLPPVYALAGKVTAGMETIERIEALGEPGGDGPPSATVVIEKATLKQG